MPTPGRGADGRLLIFELGVPLAEQQASTSRSKTGSRAVRRPWKAVSPLRHMYADMLVLLNSWTKIEGEDRLFPAARYAASAASRTRALEFVVDTGPSDQLAGATIAIIVVRGIANVLPPRWDPLFRRRLQRLAMGLTLAESGVTPARFNQGTKVEMVLGMLPVYPLAAVAAIDLEHIGSRLVLRTVDADCDPSIPATALGRAVIVAPYGDPGAQLQIGPGTATLALIALSDEGTLAREVVRAAMGALCTACGGRRAGSTSLVVKPEKTTVVIALGVPPFSW
jgi:hypothetical protein